MVAIGASLLQVGMEASDLRSQRSGSSDRGVGCDCCGQSRTETGCFFGFFEPGSQFLNLRVDCGAFLGELTDQILQLIHLAANGLLGDRFIAVGRSGCRFYRNEGFV